MDEHERKKQYIGELKAIDAQNGTLAAMVSTDSVDRDGDVIVPSGWQLENYRRNPVVLWAHRYDELPIAKALAIEPTEHGLMAMMQFADHELAQDVFELYAGGFLRAFSVGFRSIEYGPRKDEHGHGWLISRAELLEFSAVPVPANQDALVLAAKAFKLGCCRRMPVNEFFALMEASRSAKPADHYLDLAEQTCSTDSEDRGDADAQPSAALSAQVAAINALTAQLRKGV